MGFVERLYEIMNLIKRINMMSSSHKEEREEEEEKSTISSSTTISSSSSSYDKDYETNYKMKWMGEISKFYYFIDI